MHFWKTKDQDVRGHEFEACLACCWKNHLPLYSTYIFTRTFSNVCLTDVAPINFENWRSILNLTLRHNNFKDICTTLGRWRKVDITINQEKKTAFKKTLERRRRSVWERRKIIFGSGRHGTYWFPISKNCYPRGKENYTYYERIYPNPNDTRSLLLDRNPRLVI